MRGGLILPAIWRGGVKGLYVGEKWVIIPVVRYGSYGERWFFLEILCTVVRDGSKGVIVQDGLILMVSDGRCAV